MEIKKATLYDVKDICRIHVLGRSRPIRELFHKRMNTFVKIQGKQHAEIRDIYLLTTSIVEITNIERTEGNENEKD